MEKIVWVQAKFYPSFSMRPPLVQMPVTTVAADFCGDGSLSLGDQIPMRTRHKHHTWRSDAKMNTFTFFAFPQRFSQHLCKAIISFFFFLLILQELSLLSPVALLHIQFTSLACKRLLITCDCMLWMQLMRTQFGNFTQNRSNMLKQNKRQEFKFNLGMVGH